MVVVFISLLLFFFLNWEILRVNEMSNVFTYMCLSWCFLILVYIYANHSTNSRMIQDLILPSDGGLKQTPNLTCSHYPWKALHHLLSPEISLTLSPNKILATNLLQFFFKSEAINFKMVFKIIVIVMAFYSRVALFMSANSTSEFFSNEPLTAKTGFHQMGMLHQERAHL